MKTKPKNSTPIDNIIAALLQKANIKKEQNAQDSVELTTMIEEKMVVKKIINKIYSVVIFCHLRN